MSEKLLVTALACAKLADIQKELGHDGKTNMEFFELPVNDKDVETWWDSSTWEIRHNIGSLLVHYNIMSAECAWDGYSTFDRLGTSQIKRIKKAWKIRRDSYRMFDLAAMMGINRI